MHPAWFELDARTRRDFGQQLDELVARHTSVRFRWFDAEAWTGKFTDFALCEFSCLDSYNSLWGELRRHPFLATPYAHISRVIMGMEVDTNQYLGQPFTKEQATQAVEVSIPQPSPLAEAPMEELSQPGEELVAEPVSEEPVCRQCGKTLKATARFCSRCGAETS